MWKPDLEVQKEAWGGHSHPWNAHLPAEAAKNILLRIKVLDPGFRVDHLVEARPSLSLIVSLPIPKRFLDLTRDTNSMGL